MAKRKFVCKNSPAMFCYICGKYTPKPQRRNLTVFVKEAYKSYFGRNVINQDKDWAPHSCCISCSSTLRMWVKGSRKNIKMPFEQPMFWSEPINHKVDCYFCGIHVFGHSRKTKSLVKYPRVSSVTPPVPHKLGSLIPQPVELDPTRENSHEDGDTTQGDANITANDPDFHDEVSPHLVSQPELNDLARDLYLTKEGTEVLGSRLQQWNLLTTDTKTTFARRRNEKIANFFEMKEGFCLCRDPAAVMDVLSCPRNPEEWRLFIDSSKSSLKAVLLHNGNKFPSIPIVHAVGKKEDYKTLQR